MKKYLPFAITIAGALGVGTLAVLRLIKESAMPGILLGWLTFALYLLWKIAETGITRGEIEKNEINYDRGTVELCAFVEIALLVTLFLFNRDIIPFGGISGLVIMISGIGFRLWAIKSCGGKYTLRIREIGGEPVSRGPYAIIRHPSYLGTLMAHLGITIVFINPVSPFLLALWFAAVIFRTEVEDRFLMNLREYRDYSARTQWKLFPFIY